MWKNERECGDLREPRQRSGTRSEAANVVIPTQPRNEIKSQIKIEICYAFYPKF